MHRVDETPQVVVAGNIGLDLIPGFESESVSRIEPGCEFLVGSMIRCTGGAVANVGLALNRLGVRVRLVSRIGDDWFGAEVLRLLQTAAPGLATGILSDPAVDTSYTVVINPRGADRSFLHCPGASDSFAPADIAWGRLEGALIFHFGYPPCMKGIYGDGGHALKHIFNKARDRGMVTSLDMCSVDSTSAAGRVDWRTWLRRVLPSVDLFLPSLDEIHVMLFGTLPPPDPPQSLLRAIAQELIDWGTNIVVLKRGDCGLYLRSTPDWRAFPRLLKLPASWIDRELEARCFEVDVAGTTGAGDCTIAGFLAATLRGEDPESCLEMATAVGACSVEAPDAVSGLRSWDETRHRISEGWPKRSYR